MRETTDQLRTPRAVRWCLAFALALALHSLMLLLPGLARATEEARLEVYQPILVDGTAIILSRCTVIEYLGGIYPALEIAITAKANSLPVSGQTMEDRNAAHLCGIEVRVVADPAWGQRPYTDRDTVSSATVIVDASHAKQAEEITVDVAVRATVEAVLANGALSRPVIRTLRVTVLGDSAYTKYGGVFHLQRLGRLPRTKVFE
jgi:hypothetical protein